MSSCAAVAAPPEDAAAYPSRTIRLVVPTAVNGAGDALAREIAGRLGRALGTKIAVENRPGAAGMVGSEYVAHAPPDGYTLLFSTSATQVIAPHMIANLRYDPLRDFEPVINLGYATSVIVVAASLPVRTLAEFIDYAQARPLQLNYASSGVGSANHIDVEVLAAITGVRLVHVPYRGTADGYRALLAGEVQLMAGAVTSALPYVQAGKLRALAVLTNERSPLLPDVPTLAQAGLTDVDVRKWMALMAPRSTPPEIVAKLNSEVDALLREASMRDWMLEHGFEIAGGPPDAFGQRLRSDFAKWGRTIERVGVRPE